MVDEKVKNDIRNILIGTAEDDVLTLTNEVKETNPNKSHTLLQDINKTLSELEPEEEPETILGNKPVSQESEESEESEVLLEDLITLRLEPRIKKYINDHVEDMISNLIDTKLKELKRKK